MWQALDAWPFSSLIKSKRLARAMYQSFMRWLKNGSVVSGKLNHATQTDDFLTES